MDILSWENPSASRNLPYVQTYPWSNQWNEIGENFMITVPHNNRMMDGKMNGADGFFDPSMDFRGIKTYQNSLSSINVASDFNLSKRQEAIRLDGDTMLVKSGEALFTAELCSAQLINKPYSMSPLSNNLMIDFGTTNRNGDDDNKVGLSTTGSLESLECLLSRNSNTDTSVEDDGISMIFSDSRNLWDFSSGNAASSSGESENNLSNNPPDETVSQSSSNPCNNHVGSTYTRPSSSKRSKEQRDQIESNENFQCFDLPQSDSITTKAGFRVFPENPPKSKKARLEKHPVTSNINFQQPYSLVSFAGDEPDTEAIAQMKEMIYRAAAFRPVNLGLEVGEKPKRKNVRISSDPQTVAARQRRERISDRIRVLQKLVPGGSKMDTASMLDEAANYLKFLRSQVKALETLGHHKPSTPTVNYTSTNNLPYSSLSLPSFNNTFPMQTLFPFSKP